jgi:hypothetical protein
MTLTDLTQLLTTAGLFPIPVDGGIEEEDIKGMRFLGNLDGFAQAASALGSRCVFVASKTLTDADFLYDDRDGEEPTQVDLAASLPALGEFKAYLGHYCGHQVWVLVQNTTLALLVPQPWWVAFAQRREEAIELVQKRHEEAWAKEEAEQQQKVNELLHRLRAFISDPQFVHLPTQIAMQAYAVEQVPELEILGDKTLRAEIQALDAKIKAKGLRGKKT